MSTKDTESNVSFHNQLTAPGELKPTLFAPPTFEALDELTEEMEIDEPLVSKRHGDAPSAFNFK